MKKKYTPEMVKQLIKYVEGGSYIVVACRAVGISEYTFYNWIKKGEAGIEPYTKLTKSIKKAKAEAEIKNINIVQKAGEKNWQAAMTLLERKYPQRWARRDKLEVKTKKTVESKHFIEISKKVELLLPEQRKQLISLAINAEKELESNGDNNGNS